MKSKFLCILLAIGILYLVIGIINLKASNLKEPTTSQPNILTQPLSYTSSYVVPSYVVPYPRATPEWFGYMDARLGNSISYLSYYGEEEKLAYWKGYIAGLNDKLNDKLDELEQKLEEIEWELE